MSSRGHERRRDIAIEVFPPPPCEEPTSPVSCTSCVAFPDRKSVNATCSGYLCAGSSVDESERLRDYERELDFEDIDHPDMLSRPLDWRVELACRGGTWGSTPVPLRCESCQVNFSSRAMHERHILSPRHVERTLFFAEATPGLPSVNIDYHNRRRWRNVRIPSRRHRSAGPCVTPRDLYPDALDLAKTPSKVHHPRLSSTSRRASPAADTPKLGLLFSDEDDPQKLFVPQDTRAIRDRDYVEDRFDDQNAASQVFLNREGDGSNILTREALLEVMDLHETVARIDSEESTRGYDERSCAFAYWSSEPECQKESILAFWDYNRTSLAGDEDVLATINAKVDTENDCCSPTTRTLDMDRYAAKIRVDAAGQITSAGGLRIAYYLRQKLHRKTRQDPHAFRLERKFDAKTRRLNLPSFERALPLTSAGVADNVQAALDYDRLFVTLAFVTITTYSFLALASRRSSSRGLLGLLATATVGFAVAAAFGLCFAFGVQFTPITSVSAFLVLGIGLDDAFVVVGADDLASFARDAAMIARGVTSLEAATTKRVCMALAVAGPSIFTTSITDAAAFFAGSYTRIPAISSFCLFCATCVIVDFALQITLFVAFFVYDTRRKLRRHALQLAGKVGSPDDREPSAARASVKPDDDDDDDDDKTASKEEDETENDDAAAPTTSEDLMALVSRRKLEVEASRPKTWFGRVYAARVLSPAGAALVFVGTTVLIIFGAIGCANFDMHFEYEWLYGRGLENNYVPKATDFQKKWFKNFGAGEDSSTNFGIYTKRGDYFVHGDEMRALIDNTEALSFVVKGSLASNWYDAHQAWAVNVTTSREYVASVKAFLETDQGRAYAGKIVFADDDDGTIAATEIDSRWKDLGTSKAITSMRDMRRAVKRAAPSFDTIAFSPTFVWLEGLRIITRETVRSLAIACAVVVAVLVALLGDVAVAALVSAYVCTICLCTISSIYWYGDHINFLSAFFIIIAAGLATDAPAHVAHAYIHAPPSLVTGKERAAYALDELGLSVFRGVTSTLVGIVVMAGTKTYVFQTFFWYLTTIMVLGLWFGLAVAPVSLAVLGPLLVSPPAAPPSAAAAAPVAPDVFETEMRSASDDDGAAALAGRADNI
ncbi:hypothetical protein CTAYLR_000864 [Chrysophaeum taylorii]|uniref:SSD domain-containing protein n=1 Tax=Chrysophaeum taylorii TaxID=2483200 RepID=A0AAD7UR02_9STRA|nr:hypothetical protein CTAYLR_000864 [Chrysophaeum taylorii]